MADIRRLKKNYEQLSVNAVHDFPPGLQFEINDKSWDFQIIADISGIESFAYWFSVVFWQSRDYQQDATRLTYWHAYKLFSQFISTQNNIKSFGDVNKNVLYLYKGWLKQLPLANSRLEKEAGVDLYSVGSQRKLFGLIIETMKKLLSAGILNADTSIPNVSYQNSQFDAEKTHPYSMTERMSIVKACTMEFEYVNKRDSLDAKTLVPYLLTFALRTGLNLQTLLDIEVDSFKPSVLDSRYELSVRKNRGYSSQVLSLEIDKNDENSQLKYVNKKLHSLFESLVKLSSTLRNEAPQIYSSSIWLIPVRKKDNVIEIRPINPTEAWKFIQEFRAKYELIDDSGKPLKLNIRRMRPTFAHSMLRINGGDIRDLQKKMNHKNINTTMSYLDGNTEEFKSSFKFHGIVMQNALTGSSPVDLSKQLKCSVDEATKIISGENGMLSSSCKNPFKSPIKTESDSVCTNFLACFRCPNQIITKEDSQKVFSFYWYLIQKKNFMPKRAWDQNYKWIIDTIDNDISPKLGRYEDIEKLKHESLTHPHPAWKNINWIQSI